MRRVHKLVIPTFTKEYFKITIPFLLYAGEDLVSEQEGTRATREGNTIEMKMQSYPLYSTLNVETEATLKFHLSVHLIHNTQLVV